MKTATMGADVPSHVRRIVRSGLLAASVCACVASGALADDATTPKRAIRIIPLPAASTDAPTLVVEPEPAAVAVATPGVTLGYSRRIAHRRVTHWRVARRTWPLEYGDPHDGCTPWSATHWGLGRAYVC